MEIKKIYSPSSGVGSIATLTSWMIKGYETDSEGGYYAVGFFVVENNYKDRHIEFTSITKGTPADYYRVKLEDSQSYTQEMNVSPDEPQNELVLDGEKVYKEGASVTIKLSPNTVNHIQEITGFTVKDSNGTVLATANGSSVNVTNIQGELTVCDIKVKYASADFSELESCLKSVPDDECEAGYTPETWEKLQEALSQAQEAVNEGWRYDKQEELNKRTNAIEEALQHLEFSSDALIRIVTNEIAAGIPNTEFETSDKVKEELSRVLLQSSGYSTNRMVFYDVVVQFSADGGKNWVDATENNFPSQGAEVTISYPNGTGRYSHNFAVVQMFKETSARLGTTAGVTEKTSVSKTSSGIQIVLHGFSYVGIAWKSVPTPVTPSPTPIVPEGYPDGTVIEPDGTIVVPDGTQVKPDGTIILPGEDLESTEDDIYVKKGEAAENPTYNPKDSSVTIHEGNTVTYPGDMIITPPDETLVSKDGTVTWPDGTVITSDGVTHRTDGAEVAYDGTVLKAAIPMIRTVKVSGNTPKVILNDQAYGAQGYDFVISTNKNCITDKDYYQVSKDISETETDFVYVQKGTYYAYCHSWIKGADGKKIFSGWSEPYKFKITDTTPEAPIIQSIKKNANGTLTVTTVKGGPSYGYDIIFGTSLKKVNEEIRPVDYGNYVAKNRRKKTLTFPKLKPGTYYIAAHAFNVGENNKKVFSPWSNIRKIVIK